MKTIKWTTKSLPDIPQSLTAFGEIVQSDNTIGNDSKICVFHALTKSIYILQIKLDNVIKTYPIQDVEILDVPQARLTTKANEAFIDWLVYNTQTAEAVIKAKNILTQHFGETVVYDGVDNLLKDTPAESKDRIEKLFTKV